MKFTAPLLLVLLVAVLASPLATADVLLMDVITESPVNSPEGLPRPSNGQSMQKVRESFGEPVKETPWVGDPPITRWTYEEFTVFFEHNLVITSVVHR